MYSSTSSALGSPLPYNVVIYSTSSLKPALNAVTEIQWGGILTLWANFGRSRIPTNLAHIKLHVHCFRYLVRRNMCTLLGPVVLRVENGKFLFDYGLPPFQLPYWWV